MRELLQTYPGAAVAALILGFGFLIFIHELGHFLVAKWAGIRATQFAIGFGPAIASFRKGLGVRPGSTEAEYEKRARGAAGKDPTDDELYAAADGLGLGETEYRLNWLPLGGYVKMLGQEDLDPAAASQDPKSYNQKPIWKRMAVISAGVVMNLVFGILFLVLAFGPGAGVSFPAPVVGGVAPGQPAATTYASGHEGEAAYLGLRPGDRITTLGGEPVEDLVAVKIATALGGRDNTLSLEVDRPGEAAPLTYDLRPRVGRNSDNMLAVGIAPASTTELIGVAPETPWAEAGVEPGDRLVAFGEEATPAEGAAALDRAFAAAGASEQRVWFEKPDGTRLSVSASPRPSLARGDDGAVSLLGLEPLVQIDLVVEGSPAADAGLREGDVLTRVGNLAFPGMQGVLDEIAAAEAAVPARAIELTALRDGEPVDLPAATLEDGRLGIGYGPALEVPRVADAGGRGPLSLPPGSTVLGINGSGEIRGFADIQQVLQAAASGEAGADSAGRILIEHRVPVGAGSVETLEATLTDADRATLAAARWAPPAGLAFSTLKVLIRGDGVVDAASIGLVKTGEFIQQTYVTLLRLFQGDVKVTHLRGPVGIVDEGSRLAREGWPYFFYFLGIISINLAVINFLPLPIVDGGHMVFLAVEKLRGKPAGPQIQTAVTLVGLCLIAAFFVIVTYNDLFRLITRWME